MAKNTKMQFGQKQWMNYLSRNWQPLAIGVLIGFILRELLILVVVAVIVVAVAVMIKNKTEQVKQEKVKK